MPADYYGYVNAYAYNFVACCTAAYVSLRDSYLLGDCYSLHIHVISRMRLCYFTSLRYLRALLSFFLPPIIPTQLFPAFWPFMQLYVLIVLFLFYREKFHTLIVELPVKLSQNSVLEYQMLFAILLKYKYIHDIYIHTQYDSLSPRIIQNCEKTIKRLFKDF